MTPSSFPEASVPASGNRRVEEVIQGLPPTKRVSHSST